VVILFKVGDQNVRAFPGEGDGDRSTDAAVTTGDHRFLPGKAAGTLVGRFAMVGHGLHDVCQAWHWLLLIWKGRLGIIHAGSAGLFMNEPCREMFVPSAVCAAISLAVHGRTTHGA